MPARPAGSEVQLPAITVDQCLARQAVHGIYGGALHGSARQCSSWNCPHRDEILFMNRTTLVPVTVYLVVAAWGFGITSSVEAFQVESENLWLLPGTSDIVCDGRI